MSAWTKGTEGPRRYNIDVKEAQWQLATRADGSLIQFGDTNLMNLVLSGDLTYINEDGDEIGKAEAEDGFDYPSRNYTMGTVEDFPDEDQTGERVVQAGRSAPRAMFDGGSLFNTMIDNIGGEWLVDNLGEWTEASSWVGHTFTIQPTPRVNDMGEAVYRKKKDDDGNRVQEIDSVCLAIDGFTLLDD